MIRRLRVVGYKSLRDCQIELAPLTVIAGPNGAGKSNLIDLIALLSRLAVRDTVTGAFGEHRGRPLEAFHSEAGFGQSAYEALLARERLVFSVECDLDLNPRIVEGVNHLLEQRERVSGAKAPYTRVTETRLRYRVEITLHPRSGEIFVSDESLCALRRDYTPKPDSVRAPFIEKTVVGEVERFVARVEKQSHPRYFDSGRVRTLLSELSDPVYHPHVVAAAREIASWRVFYVEPNRMREDVGVQSAEDPGRAGEYLAPYYYFLQEKYPASLRGIVRNLRDFVPGIEDLRVDARKGLLEIVCVMAGNAEFPARLLSEGTLRLLCVLGIAVAPSAPTLVVYEEPENGVNPARLDLIAQIIRDAATVRPLGMQFLLTTHSALVCDLLPENLVTCSWSREGGTRFAPMSLERDTLFFEEEVRRVLDEAAKPIGGR